MIEKRIETIAHIVSLLKKRSVTTDKMSDIKKVSERSIQLSYHIHYLSKHDSSADFVVDSLNFLKTVKKHDFADIDEVTRDLLFETIDRLVQNEIMTHVLDDLVCLFNEPKNDLGSLFEYLGVLQYMSTRLPSNVKETLSFRCFFKILSKFSDQKTHYKKKIPKDCERLLCMILDIIENISLHFDEKSFQVHDAARTLIRFVNDFDAYFTQCLSIIRNIYDYEEAAGNEDDQINDDCTENVKKEIEIVLSIENGDDLIRSRAFSKAIRYIVNNLKHQRFEFIHEKEERNLFACLLVDFIDANYKTLCEDLKRISNDELADDTIAIKRLSFIHYITTCIIGIYATQSFEFNMIYVGKSSGVNTIFYFLQNEAIHHIVLKSDSSLIKSLYSKTITAYVKLLHQIKYFFNQFKEVWQPYDSSLLFNLSRTLAKFDVDSHWFMNIIPFILNYDDDKEEVLYEDVYTRHTATECCEYLIKVDDPKKVFNSRRALNYLTKFVDESNKSHEFDSEFLKKCIKLFVGVVQHGHSLLAANLKQYDAENIDYQDPVDDILKVDLILRNTIYLMQTFADKSIQFCISFHEEENVNGVKIFLDLLSDPVLLKYFLNCKSNSVIKLLTSSFYEYLLTAVYNLSKAAFKYKERWTTLNAFATLLDLGKKLRLVNSHFKLMSYLIIGNIASDEDLNNFSASLSILETITSIVKTFSEGLSGPASEIKRSFFQIDENDPSKVEIIVVRGWNLFEILESLYKFSINDNIKGVIYDTLKMKEYLRMVISNGNEVEQEIAFKLLKQLCFDKRIASDIQYDADLVGYMNYKISNKSTVVRENLIRNIESVLWLINENDHKQISKNESLKHIFISYNSESRGLCVALKNTLQSLGHDVWIDTENIHGSSIDCMARGIESSWCILMCITERYKESANCRLEAEYAVQQKKPIIPLMMQSHFKPDGWLGLIMGTKIYIDFTKHDYEECISRLKKELSTLKYPIDEKLANAKNEKITKNTHKRHSDPYMNRVPVSKRSISLETAQVQNCEFSMPSLDEICEKKITPVSEWLEFEVDKWFESKNIQFAIREMLAPCNGLLLEQYYQMSKEAPEFFYSTIRVDAKASMRDIALFAVALKALFPKS